MQHIRNIVLRYVRLSAQPQVLQLGGQRSYVLTRNLCASSTNTSSEQLTARVVELVKKFDKIDANKVTETANFQKDLSLDSLDRVELVMAFEQEFLIEIPDDKADKLTCCADVVKYIQSDAQSHSAESA